MTTPTPQHHRTTEPGSSFAGMLRGFRQRVGLSQEELASRASLTPNAVGALERGEHKHPYPATVRALAEALELTEDERSALASSVPRRGTAPPRMAPSFPSLPTPLSRLIGRDDEVAAVTALLESRHVRLVTLTGPGGVGKTCLALHIASRMNEAAVADAAVVDLAPMRDPALVMATIAHVMGVPESVGPTLLERVANALADRSFLLVLDNFEHLLEAAPLVSDLLTRCPTLIILATSRAPLRLDGEHEVPVLPLALPVSEWDPSVEDVAVFPAIQLFLERARAVDPTLVLTSGNAAAVTAICQRLDGLPLAIELAAARSRLFPPAALLPRLARRLPLLTVGRRDAPERHRTMRDAIAWSYDMLGPAEQVLFRTLSVFAGGFTLAAASRVTACEEYELLDGISALSENSLLRRVEDGVDEPRYGMLETVREFARDQLALSGELDTLRDRHAHWCVTLVEAAASRWFTGEQTAWADRLDAEHDNIRAALNRMDELGWIGEGPQLAGRLWPFWFVRGHHSEGRRWLQRALAQTGDSTIHRARMLTGLSCLARCQGENTHAAPWDEEALRIVNDIGAEETIDAVHVHIGLALDAAIIHDAETVDVHCKSAMTILQGMLDVDPSAAPLASSVLNILAEMAFEQGNDEQAWQLAEHALAEQRRTGFDWAAADALVLLALVARRRGNIAQAALLCRDSLALTLDHRDPQTMPVLLDQVAFLARCSGRTIAATRLLGAADSLYLRFGLPPDREGIEERKAHIAALRDSLCETDFTASLAEGQLLSLAQASAEAMGVAEEIASSKTCTS